MTPRVHIRRDFYIDDDRLFIYRDTDRRDRGFPVIELASGFVWQEHIEGDAWITGDGIGRARELIQKIVDKAWEIGYRPSGFTDIKNETAALREHLADMKRVAFHQLKIR